jgi:hypothetical protein
VEIEDKMTPATLAMANQLPPAWADDFLEKVSLRLDCGIPESAAATQAYSEVRRLMANPRPCICKECERTKISER